MAEFRPLISIITPTYNHERFISACIESVLAQTYPHWEQIIIDDGSTDRTAEIVSSYGDPRIKYLHQENLGLEQLAKSYNRALADCNGELVAILEGDDFWPEHKLETVTRCFKDSDAILTYGLVAESAASSGGSSYLPRRTKKRRRISRAILNNDPPGTAVKYMMTFSGVDLIGASSVVIRSTALKEIGGFQYVPGLCVTDYPTFLTLAPRGKFVFCDAVLGFRRRHLGSATYANVDKIIKGARRFADDFVRRNNIGLSESDLLDIEASWVRCDHVKEFEQGRISLVSGRWLEARQHFTSSFSMSDPLVSLAAAVGWGCSMVHTDLEAVFRLFGKADLRQTHGS